MLKLRKVKLADNFGSAAGKWVAMTVHFSIVDTDSIVKQASLASGLPQVSIRAAVDAYLAAAETFMFEGHRVRLGKLGLFGVKSKSEATSDINKVSAKLLPSWRASSEFREMVANIPTEFVAAGGTVTGMDGDEVVDDIPDGPNAGDKSGIGKDL